MDVYYIDPLLLLGLQGAVTSIIIIFLLIFVGPLDCEFEIGLCTKDKSIDSFSDAISYFSSHINYLLLYLLQIIMIYFYNICLIFTNYYYSPQIRLLSKIVRAFMRWFIYFIPFLGNNLDKNIFNLLIELLSILLQLSGAFIFIELVIIRVFGMDKNVSSEIIKREVKDFIDSDSLISTEIVTIDCNDNDNNLNPDIIRSNMNINDSIY